ncbi:MAG: peptide-methionine (S)-S-oxide reductase MsrA [Pseudomonadales bacterium]|nr:peptide-methionine (S)-S-oxide reductase MsrA [Pseudomonadales bacterium]
MFERLKNAVMPNNDSALPGRSQKMPVSAKHFVLDAPLEGPFNAPYATAMFGLGCFWGAERQFWQLPGVYTTSVGYAAGATPNPSYEEVCSGRTGHNEVVLVVYDTSKLSYRDLLKVFWESHDPTQGMRQGGDQGTQYRSGIYTYTDDQAEEAAATQTEFQSVLTEGGFPTITTEVLSAPEYYYAEDYHQQYLAKNPGGYCGLGGVGACLPETGLPENK